MRASLKERYNIIYQIVNDPWIEGPFNPALTNDKANGPQIPSWLNGKTLYEIYIRSFTSSGTFRNAQQQLPGLKETGIDIIWLMPVYPIGKKERKGTLGSPYSVSDYFTTNPEYGTPGEFKNFIDAAHALGMKVILDIVPNHVAHDFNKLAEIPGLVRRNEKGLPDRKVDEWSDIVDLDYSNPQTRVFMEKVLNYWITHFGLDGYRVDVAGLVPVDFWTPLLTQLRENHPRAIFLAEWFGPQLHHAGFHATYDWMLYELMLRVFNKRESAHTLLEWQNVRYLTYPKNALPLRFIENHDKKRAAAIFESKNQIPFLVFIFSIDGIPLVYNGQEIGAEQTLSLFEKQQIDWDNPDEQLSVIYKQLIQIRKKHAGLSSPEISTCMHNQIPDALVFEKKGYDLIIMINVRNRMLAIDCGKELIKKISGAEIVFNSHTNLILNNNKIEMQPFQAVIASYK